jgi:MFS family permease
LLDLALFRDAVFTRGLIVSVGVYAAFFGVMFSLTLVLQSGLGLNPLEAGYTFAPLSIAFAGASILAPTKVAKYGARLVTTGIVIAGAGVLALGVVLHVWGSQMTIGLLLGPMILIGLGNGLAVPVLAGVVLAGARTAQAGIAAGVLTTSQQFSSAAGVAIIGTVFFNVLASDHGLSGFANAMQWVVGIALVVLLVSCLASLMLPRPARAARQ